MDEKMDLEFEDISKIDDLKKLELIREWRNKEEIRKFMINDHKITKQEHKKWLDKIRNDGKYKAWFIKYKKKPIGLAYLTEIDYENKLTNWGFYIADETMRGKGIGFATLYKLMIKVFDEMGFKKMKTTVLKNNKIAIKLYEKMGFKKEGKTKQQLMRDMERVNVIPMGILQNEWKEIKEKLNSSI
jgi:UDP-4-amino-4,6-dideoxy-N-acetyl-beta-L-altrosamine N-acetyltransferase